MDLCHWSSAEFSSTWYDTLSVLVAKGRAQVTVVATSSGDWSKRIRDMQYTDHEDYEGGRCDRDDFHETMLASNDVGVGSRAGWSALG